MSPNHDFSIICWSESRVQSPGKKTYIVFPIHCAPIFIFILYTATTILIHHIILSFQLQTQLSNTIREAAFVSACVILKICLCTLWRQSELLFSSKNFLACDSIDVTLDWSYLLRIYVFFTKSMSLLKSLVPLIVMVRRMVRSHLKNWLFDRLRVVACGMMMLYVLLVSRPWMLIF